ncbi:MAG TPA: hypothetical protein PKA02_03845 [Candidatus Saccharibacteria bacterium]|nr:hypothetical protein [Candidatus Saccharibacteria bacterium]
MTDSRQSPREIIDPHGTLPHVELVVDPEKKQGKGTVVPVQQLIMHQGEPIGRATLTHSRTSGEAWFNGIEITDTKLRGKGFGLATYLAAIENAHGQGETFRTHDTTQTDAAVRVWTRFIDSGIAEVVVPFEQYNFTTVTGEHKLVNAGHAQIPPTPTSTG